MTSTIGYKLYEYIYIYILIITSLEPKKENASK